MAVRPGPKNRVRFFYSPFIETVLSLQVLYDTRHHGALLPWVIRFKEKVSPETYRDLRYFGDNVREWLYLIDFALELPDLDRLSFTEVVERIRGLPDAAFVFRLLGEQVPEAEVEAALADHGRVSGAIGHLDITEPRRREGLVRLFRTPADVREELCAFLLRYWEQYFKEEYHWVELALVRGIKDEARRLEEEALPRFLSRLSGGLISRDKRLRRPPQPDRVVIESGSGTTELDLGSLTEIALFPSLFVSPQSIFELEDGRLVMSFSVEPGVYLRRDTLVPPEQLSRLLKTLADETRLQILKLMMTDRQCTQGLAVELGLAEPTISRHLKLLRDAELISPVKEGNYIFYTLRLERIAELHTKLIDFLRA